MASDERGRASIANTGWDEGLFGQLAGITAMKLRIRAG